MPLNRQRLDAQGVPIVFEDPGDVHVRIGRLSSKAFKEPTIPLDGRRYKCAGHVIFADGRRLRADFQINTGARIYLDRRVVWCTLDGDDWYSPDDPELATLLGVPRRYLRSYQWMPDRPLANSAAGPYPITWPWKSLRERWAALWQRD